MSSQRRLFVFIHVATIGRYLEIFAELMEAVSRSGLLAKAADVVVSCVGEGELPLPDASPLHFFRRGKLEDFEFPTLDLLQEKSRHESSAAVLYLHVKGASVRSHRMAAADAWRRYMLHFLVDRHEEALSHLNECDVCGVDWRRSPVPHFSGNFWWARSEYISKLPDVQSLSGAASSPLSPRHNAEFWIGMNPQVRAYSMFDCGIPVDRRYNYQIPRSIYVNKTGCPSRAGKLQLEAFRIAGRILRRPL